MRSWVKYPLAFMAVMASGCAHFAKIPTWHPTSAHVEGVQTVAVLPFEGEWGTRVAEEVSDAFSNSGAYTIVSASSLPLIRTVSSSDGELPLDQILAAARQADIDAILVGTIDSQDAPEGGDSRSLRSAKPAGPDSSMTLTYRLIDTRTGEILSQNQVVCLESDSKSKAQREGHASQTLIQRCGHEVVSQLTPQPGDCSIALATGSWMERGGFWVRRGVRAAEKGEWDEATRAWETALEKAPENHAAIFNLALASASKQKFAKAEELALEAIRIQHSDCYEKGLAQIREQRSQFENASQQRGRE